MNTSTGARVAGAIKKGILVRQPCEVCGLQPAFRPYASPFSSGGCWTVKAHHDDYSKPLAVRWLCDRHHIEHHVSAGSYRKKGLKV